MFIIQGKQVTDKDIEFFVDRRGFNDLQRAFLNNCMIYVGLGKGLTKVKIENV